MYIALGKRKGKTSSQATIRNVTENVEKRKGFSREYAGTMRGKSSIYRPGRLCYTV